jgi:hypothetical protein
MTISKMILFNLDMLLKVSKQVQDKFLAGKAGGGMDPSLNKRNLHKETDNLITHKM